MQLVEVFPVDPDLRVQRDLAVGGVPALCDPILQSQLETITGLPRACTFCGLAPWLRSLLT